MGSKMGLKGLLLNLQYSQSLPVQSSPLKRTHRDRNQIAQRSRRSKEKRKECPAKRREKQKAEPRKYEATFFYHFVEKIGEEVLDL